MAVTSEVKIPLEAADLDTERGLATIVGGRSVLFTVSLGLVKLEE